MHEPRIEITVDEDAWRGTGWCGTLRAPRARRLVGADRSTGMLDHARAKGVYDDVIRAELVGYLQPHGEEFDVIVSADNLVSLWAAEDRVAQVLTTAGLIPTIGCADLGKDCGQPVAGLVVRATKAMEGDRG